MTSTAGPLSGIRIIEAGTMVAGPVAATLLGDLGADVIKIEQPGSGDPIRQSGPGPDGESLYYNVENRNKRSLTLNLRDPEGQEILRKLCDQADVLIENFRPGTMKRWGVGYDVLRTRNPNLIMLSISGFGQNGPNAELAAYDRIALSFSGFLNMSGYPDRPPVRPGIAVADYWSALFGAFSVMVALFNRQAGRSAGQSIDIAMYETIFRFTDIMITAYDKYGIKRERSGNSHYAAAPGDHYMTSEGRYLVLTVSGNAVFRRLCAAMNKDLADDPRFANNNLRVQNYDVINGIVAEWVRTTPQDQVIAALTHEGVPHSLIKTVEEIAVDPHYEARGTIVTVDTPRLGPLKMSRALPVFSDIPTPAIKPAPALGEHTKEILSGLLNMSAEDVKMLRECGVV